MKTAVLPLLRSLSVFLVSALLAACGDRQPGQLTIEPPNSSIPAGTKVHLLAFLNDGSGPKALPLGSTATWESSAPNIAKIDLTGDGGADVTGLSAGTATITAAFQSAKATATITVNTAQLTSIDVAPINFSLVKGLSQQMTAIGTFSDQSKMDITGMATWSSSDANIASITSSGGLSTGVNTGTAELTATLGAISGKTAVTVTAATLVSISITPPNLSVAQGTKQQFTANQESSNTPSRNQATACLKGIPRET